jgi:ankyrin repeat protein
MEWTHRDVQLLWQEGAALDLADNHRDRTPLSFATSKGHENTVVWLPQRGANAESKDLHDPTPGWWATS